MMHSYLVTALDRMSGQMSQFIVQASCPHGMQEFVDTLAAEGKIDIPYPVVIDVDDRTAAHLPLVDPVE